MSAVFSDRGHGPLVEKTQFSVGRELGGAFLAVLTAAVVPGLIMVAFRGADSFGSAGTDHLWSDAPITVQVDGVAETSTPTVSTDIGDAAVQLAAPVQLGAESTPSIALSSITDTGVDATFQLSSDSTFRIEVRVDDELVSVRDGSAVAGQVFTASFDGLAADTDHQLRIVLRGPETDRTETVWFRTASG